nr:hypothetical protein Q903MT_gene1828 [Picea sitchensis]
MKLGRLPFLTLLYFSFGAQNAPKHNGISIITYLKERKIEWRGDYRAALEGRRLGREPRFLLFG